MEGAKQLALDAHNLKRQNARMIKLKAQYSKEKVYKHITEWMNKAWMNFADFKELNSRFLNIAPDRISNESFPIVTIQHFQFIFSNSPLNTYEVKTNTLC